LKAEVSDYDIQSDESELFWSVYGEENVLKCPEFENYLSIQKSNANGGWEDITAGEYLSLKNSCLGNNPRGNTVWDLSEISHDFFDENDIMDSVRSPNKSEIHDFFDSWTKTANESE